MSRNDQLLVKEHKGKFYVFSVMAESWGGFDSQPLNELSTKEALGVFDTRDEAHVFAEAPSDDIDIYVDEEKEKQ